MSDEKKSQNVAGIFGGVAAMVTMMFLRDQIPGFFMRVLVAGVIGAIFGAIGVLIERAMNKSKP